ncbi:hypothetical protein BV22DRAFT_1187193 [Leucogyrophana mollusca]|uniref:Uncharacterized protein n=1 Tax=Leucogyrophana mollusca TaxID=85980 RepID=A0ACB8AXC4_9AGAM|nr:hypothetical protein BV22DRAFT_1187193 [Leucogyrophana mollusca]
MFDPREIIRRLRETIILVDSRSLNLEVSRETTRRLRARETFSVDFGDWTRRKREKLEYWFCSGCDSGDGMPSHSVDEEALDKTACPAFHDIALADLFCLLRLTCTQMLDKGVNI